MFSTAKIFLAKQAASGPAPANVIVNGGFASSASWDGLGSNGKSVSGGKAHFVASSSFDGISQSGLTLVVGKYYELVWTISGLVPTCDTTAFLWSNGGGGGNTNGTFHAADGTYTERLLASTGQNAFGFHISSGGTGTLDVDDVSLTGPYNTSTPGGA